MPIKLTTTLDKIDKIENITKSQLNLLKYFVENPNTIRYKLSIIS